MKYSAASGVRWTGIFLVLVLIPMLIAVLSPPAPRTFWIEFGVGLGFVGLSMMALQFLFSGRFRCIAPVFGADNLLHFHREIGIVGFMLVLAHPAVLFLAEPGFLEYFDPRVNAPRAVSLSFATVALTVIIVSTLWRRLFNLTYEWWRLLHGVLSLAVVGIGLAHAFMVDHYLEPFWKKALLALMIGAMMYLVVHTRVVRPWLMKKRPYRVVDVRPERGDSWTLTLRPDGHEGLRFEPGQFAWITIGESPFRLQQHPFSFSSSARSKDISFTAKEMGDFTSTWGDIEPGTSAFLEGPLGSFIPDSSPGTGLFLLMGGIGVTPAMSMLRTMRDANDPRQVILMYGNPTWDEVTFRDELDELTRQIDLAVIHVLEEPPDEWEGEEGLITKELIEKYLPVDRHTCQYFICGPDPMMNIAETSLRDLGIDWTRIYTERFEIV